MNTLLEIDYDEIIKNNLSQIEGLDVRVDYNGNFETNKPTVWVAGSEVDLSIEDMHPRRYMCSHKIGLIVFDKTNLKEWAKKVFIEIEKNKSNENWENIKVNNIKKATEGSTEYYYLEVEVIYNYISEYSSLGGEAVTQII